MRYWPVYGGGETITVTLSNELVKRGHHVHIAYLYEKICDPMPYQIDDSVITHKLYTVEGFKHKDVNALRQIIIANSIDVMINQWGNTTLCSKAKRGTKCKLITCWHLDVIRKPDRIPNGKFNVIKAFIPKTLLEVYNKNKQIRQHKLNYKLSDKYVFLSKSFVNEYLNVSKTKDIDHKLYAISNPLTYNFEYNLDDYPFKQKKVLFVGRIYEYHKRLSYVLKIWQHIEQNDKLNEWTLDIVGGGPDMQETKDLAESLNLKRVSFKGFCNPQPFYERSSVFMMTSAFEGFGMTLVEAQQYAVVPMAMDTYGSLHDIIENGKNGIIIKDNDICGYGKALEKLLIDNAYRKNLAISGLLSCKLFKIENIINEWESLFNIITK